MAETSSSQVAGMTCTHVGDGIHIYRFKNNRRETVDAWFEQSHQDDMDGFARGEPVCHVIDLRGIWITPYTIARAVQNARRTPDGLKECTAVIVGDNFVMGMIEGLVRQFPVSVQMTTRVFRSEDAAMNWIKQRRDSLKAASQTETGV